MNAGFGQLRLTPETGPPDLSLAGRFPLQQPRPPGPSSTIWNFSGQYQWSMGVYAKAEFGTNFALPSAEELYAEDPTAQEKGNPNLKPEETTGGEFTLGRRARGDGPRHPRGGHPLRPATSAT